MNTVINTHVSENRGKPRIWIEGEKISPSFEPGDRYFLDQDVSNKRITLRSNPDGDYKVSVRNRNNRSWPLIELRGEDVSSVFEVAMSLRIVISKGKVLISVHGREQKSCKRVAEFINRILKKEEVEIGSIFTGLGVLDKAIHQGLSDCGINSYTKFVVEREHKYIDTCVSNQNELFRNNSTIVHSSIEDVEFNAEVSVDILLGSLPCTGSSIAGATKKKLLATEFDEDCGAAFYFWLNFVQKCQPLIVIMENVIPFLKSLSMAVIKSVLNTLGYDVKLKNFNGNDYGCIESRDRMVMIAVSKKLNENECFEMDSITPFKERENSINDILDHTISNTDPRWKTYDYLAKKEVRDLAEKKGFRRDIVDGTERSIGTIRRLYHKAGSCDQFIKHPEYEKNGLTRLFSPIEHARLKGIPEELIKGVSATCAHEMLGQSVCFPIFQALGRSLGKWSLKLS